eukprot:TRINITY_DN1848_c0_g4_i1.p2 TRINITY_DN1848_c0_g4~~TRINITY_DN1848_c0_g4_i1.p2  ORF type:complete len:467 (-),score=170.77 TRINITY_DN1848_c0_g4_i1:192-1592(-)
MTMPRKMQRSRSSVMVAALVAVAAVLLWQSCSVAFLSSALLGARPLCARSPAGRRAASLIALAARGGDEGDAFKVGDRVTAMSSEDEQFYPGQIEAEGKEGTFTVKWDDPDGGPETEDVKPENMKLIVIYKDYKVGEDVEAVFPEDGVKYAAVVEAVNKDGTFTVKWADPDGGPEKSDVKAEEMSYPPIPLDKLEAGQKYKGTVRSVLDFGAFVDIGAEVDGLVHISRVANERVNDIYEYLQEGQEIDCWVSEIRDDGKLGLSMVESKIGGGGGRRAPADLTPFGELNPDDFYDGVVARTAPFGAFVTVKLPDGPEADGLVHISQIRDGFVDNVDDELSEGQEVKVRVLMVDMERNQMKLSMKEGFGGGGGGGGRQSVDLAPFEAIEENTWLTGKVARIAAFGAFVTVTAPGGEVADGLVHVTQIRDGFVERVEDELQEGQEVQVRIQSVDTYSGKMSLSMKEAAY